MLSKWWFIGKESDLLSWMKPGLLIPTWYFLTILYPLDKWINIISQNLISIKLKLFLMICVMFFSVFHEFSGVWGFLALKALCLLSLISSSQGPAPACWLPVLSADSELVSVLWLMYFGNPTINHINNSSCEISRRQVTHLLNPHTFPICLFWHKISRLPGVLDTCQS